MAPTRSRLALVVNPAAGRGRALAVESSLARALVRAGFRVESFRTEGPGHASSLARSLQKEAELVVAVGGDGTVHEVVNGLMPSPGPIGIFPTGSGNDLAALLDLTADPDTFASRLLAGRGARIDVLSLGPRYCINSAGLGFEAQVTAESTNIRRLRGIPLYLGATLKALLHPTRTHFTITLAEGRRIEGEKLFVSLGNGVSAGGGFRLTPQAFPDDGLVDVCLAEPMSRLAMLALLPTVLWGGHRRSRRIEIVRSRSAMIEAARAFHLHVDGEYLGFRTWRLEARPLARLLPVVGCGPRARLSRSQEKLLILRNP